LFKINILYKLLSSLTHDNLIQYSLENTKPNTYHIARYFRRVFIFGYFEETLLFENKFLVAPFYEENFASYNTLKYTYFKNKIAEIDVQAIVRKFLVQILRTIWYKMVKTVHITQKSKF